MHWVDPDYLPETTGTIDQFIVNRHGETDGLLLTDGTEVHVPPHLSSALMQSVQLGSTVKIRGVRPRGVDMVSAVAIVTPKGRILDEGPQAREHEPMSKSVKHGPMSVQGVVKRPIHGPKGELRGAILKDGRIVRLPPHEAARFADLLRKGAHITVTGDGAKSSAGTVVEAHEVGSSADTLQRIEHKHGPRPAPKRKGPEHHGLKEGPH
ncbi:hypothetical protein AB8A20_02245 [Tardiphaga sp. 604_B6_N1_1]|uniref:hypothetical protein n=1 Tax=unclassified Tardiphaga TaxID=2631404 RepID=UPI003F279062